MVGQRSRWRGCTYSPGDLQRPLRPTRLSMCYQFCFCRGIAGKQEAEGGVEDTKKIQVKLVKK